MPALQLRVSVTATRSLLGACSQEQFIPKAPAPRSEFLPGAYSQEHLFQGSPAPMKQRTCSFGEIRVLPLGSQALAGGWNDTTWINETGPIV
jgi:hypothetical protein